MQHHPNSSPSPASRPRAFTLTEMLIVVGLIVLIILLALPAFNALTGGRSMEAAGNQISALLGRARAEAIGLQEVAGVMFFVNPRNDRITAALVREVQPQPEEAAPGVVKAEAPGGVIFLDVIPNRDFIPLPVGIDLQMIDNAVMSGSTRQDNGYIGYNPPQGGTLPGGFATAHIGGVILFDGDGRLVSRKWCLIAWQDPPGPDAPVVTGMGQLIYNFAREQDSDRLAGTNTGGVDQYVQPGPAMGSNPVPNDTMPTASDVTRMMRSQFGFVLVETTPFIDLGHTRTETLPDTAANYSAAELAEEIWIDENGLPFLVNRYNGTLTRGE